MVFRVIGKADVAAQVHRDHPWDLKVGPPYPRAHRLVQVFQEEAVHRHPLTPAPRKDFGGFRFREKMPGHLSVVTRSLDTGLHPIAAIRALAGRKAIAREPPQRA